MKHKISFLILIGVILIANSSVIGSESFEQLILELSGKDPMIRWEAAQKLGELGDKRAIDHLIKALNDEHPYVRRQATKALGNFDDERIAEPVKRMLNDGDSFVRKYATEVMEKITRQNPTQKVIELKPPAIDTVDGTIKQLDKVQKLMIVKPNKPDGKKLEISWNDKTQVVLPPGRSATIDDLKVGQEVRIEYTSEKSVLIIRNIPTEVVVDRIAKEIKVVSQTAGVKQRNKEFNEGIRASTTNVINDYLALIVWIINSDRFSTDVWQTGRSLLDKHHMEEAKAKGSVLPESFQIILATSGFALKFGAVWIDPLPFFVIDSRGDFPPIQIRNGSVSLVDDKVNLRINIADATEVMVDGVQYIYKHGQWNKM